MKWYVLVAHPNPKSFNHAVCRSLCAGILKGGGEYTLKDLYAENFDPLFRGQDFNQFSGQGALPDAVLAEQAQLDQAEALALIYPVWWNEAPAILKGWIDRVLSHGYAYKVYPDGRFEGLLTLKRVLILTTADNPLELLEEAGLNQAARLTKELGTFQFCGVKTVQHEVLGEVSSNQAAREAFLRKAAELGRTLS